MACISICGLSGRLAYEKKSKLQYFNYSRFFHSALVFSLFCFGTDAVAFPLLFRVIIRLFALVHRVLRWLRRMLLLDWCALFLCVCSPIFFTSIHLFFHFANYVKVSFFSVVAAICVGSFIRCAAHSVRFRRFKQRKIYEKIDCVRISFDF